MFPRGVRYLFGGLYTWFITVFSGAVLLDVVYSSQLDRTFDSMALSSVYNEVSDFLLLLGAFSVLTALAAIAVSWDAPSARNLFVMSLLVMLVFEFLVPIVLFPFLRNSPNSSALGIGPFIRLVATATSSLLALVGFHCGSSLAARLPSVGQHCTKKME